MHKAFACASIFPAMDRKKCLCQAVVIILGFTELKIINTLPSSSSRKGGDLERPCKWNIV
jgi:hypothetical protein